MAGLLSLLGCAGKRPENLGAQEGLLNTCPDSPNCVSSADARDSHHVDPIRGSLTQVREALSQMAGARVVQENGPYLYAEFTTRIMGFVDDVEFLEIPEEGIVQVRSASRLGYSDLGENRERVEAIRAAVTGAP